GGPLGPRVRLPAHPLMQHALLDWWEGAGRHDLPWRLTRDPWAILVSELMLQQTQVSRVVTRHRTFLKRFPSATACADAPVGDVVSAWAGLGYNRRAVSLHRAATAVCDGHDGTVPDDLDALLALPGVGPYTSRAVLVFAFERDIGLVDTNAGRFVARALAGRALGAREAQAVADAAVPAGRGWAWGQAVFDLGATTCTKRAPACDSCPVRMWCAWARSGFAAPDPVTGSAGISGPQSRFAGSFRQGRGRLVAALRAGPVADEAVAATCGWPDQPERAAEAARSLIDDGLAIWDKPSASLQLP
ncbi:MAG: A/G-specific adenine glycosylase, partial [Acidimicrobiales bacterium]